MTTAVESTKLSASDLAIDHDMADIALGFRFLLDVTPVNVAEAREAFLAGTDDTPQFAYRALEDDPAIARERLAAVAV